MEAFVNVRNLLDRDPSEVPNPNQYFAVRTNSAIYDVHGRVYRAGLRFNL